MENIQLSLFGKTYPEHFPATGEKTSGKLLKRLRKSETGTFLFLNLTESGNLLGPCWERAARWPGAYWTPNTGECPKEERESSLSQILEGDVPEKYYLSGKACRGILNRAARRKKPLPDALRKALEQQASQGKWEPRQE